jgi:F-box and leucine-rich repeat protein 2/20
LNDISFEESDDEDGDDEDVEHTFEGTKALKRLPQTILTEENLKVYLTGETERLNLEHAYWLKDVFLDKIGRMAPNLRELSLRRLRISNRAFSELVTQLKRLEIVDLSDCNLIADSGLKVMLVNNQKTL